MDEAYIGRDRTKKVLTRAPEESVAVSKSTVDKMNKALAMLNGMLEEISLLQTDIEGEDLDPGPATIHGYMNLSQLLDKGPDDIMGICSQMHDRIVHINQLLFG